MGIVGVEHGEVRLRGRVPEGVRAVANAHGLVAEHRGEEGVAERALINQILKAGDGLVRLHPPATDKLKLIRSYQAEGFAWMVRLAHAGLGLRWRFGDRYLLHADWSHYVALLSEQRSREYRALTLGLFALIAGRGTRSHWVLAAIAALPLLAILPGLLRGRAYTAGWASMVVSFYCALLLAEAYMLPRIKGALIVLSVVAALDFVALMLFAKAKKSADRLAAHP